MSPALISGILLLISMAMVLVAPFLSALFSKQVSGADRFFWALASLLFSWLGYFVYYYLRLRGRQTKG